jgi:membrane protease YdiL (CAAX protease family)
MTSIWVWQSPPGWPEPPPGWQPPAGWAPPLGWPPAPIGWQFWAPGQSPALPLYGPVPPQYGPVPPLYGPTPPQYGPVPPLYGPVPPLRAPVLPVHLHAETRASLIWETRFVMAVFLTPAVLAAVVILVQHFYGGGNGSRFPSITPDHPVTNLILGILSYIPVAAVVPVTLYLLKRTGQPPSSLGIARPSFTNDILPGLGLAAASFGAEIAMLIPFAGLLAHHSKLVNQVALGHLPHYYVIFGLVVSATTAITEEVLVNGYLLTRLGQLGWNPRSALILSLTLRTSYHIYYGLGFLLTIPFGWFVTRSFQKHGRLNRAIAAHFLFDSIVFTIAILTS